MPLPAEHERHCGPKPHSGSVSLPVLHPHGVRKSKMGPRRAVVLILVNALMVGHLVFWAATGMRRTLSPVEPSESMYTLEKGAINAGFIFFGVALLSTLIFGRWFCGWGCHIVALQDWCAWIMKKCGVKPKPFRSRLLVFFPLFLALYMFVWPTFKREVIKPVAGEQAWASVAPYLGEVGPRPGMHWELTKENFWETFASWYVAIPFLLVCGFGTVYFLGAKGFCAYGCPYGGFFGPIDTVAPGRIIVTDACEHCGHCTSVCTSNVRVHEEVRDYGMVVDSGCMRCMDCVSVCPNDALYYGFAKPPVLKPARRRRLYDLTWPEELACAALFLALFTGFRGMLGLVPLLMAAGLAGIGTMLAWTLWRMVREPSVRVQSLQLKLKGSVRPWGLAFGVLALLTLATGAWGLSVWWSQQRGDILTAGVTVPLSDTFRPTYTPPSDQRERAESALANLRRASTPALGGWGWNDSIQHSSNLAYLCMVLERFDEAETHLTRVVDQQLALRGRPEAPDVGTLADVMMRRGQPPEQMLARVRGIVAAAKQPAEARAVLAFRLAALGRMDEAIAEATTAVKEDPITFRTLDQLAAFLGNQGRLNEAMGAYVREEGMNPRLGSGPAGIGLCLAEMGRFAEALPPLDRALASEPQNVGIMGLKADVLDALGRHQEAADLRQLAAQVRSTQPPSRPGVPHR